MSTLVNALKVRKFFPPTNAIFDTIFGKDLEVQYTKIADPLYGKKFSGIFERSPTVNGITRNERCMSLLNSLIYPDVKENGFKIRHLRILEKTKDLMFRYHTNCECTSWAPDNIDKKEVFNVKFRACFDSEYPDNIGGYSAKLESENEENRDISLTFLKSVDPHNYVGWKDRPIYEKLDPYCIDLADVSTRIGLEPIYVGGNEIGQTGLEWLKLLSVRYWASEDGSKYCVPKDGANDSCVNSALNILEDVDEHEIKMLYKYEYSYKEMAMRAFKESRKYGWDDAKNFNALRLIQVGFKTEKIAEILDFDTESIEALRLDPDYEPSLNKIDKTEN